MSLPSLARCLRAPLFALSTLATLAGLAPAAASAADDYSSKVEHCDRKLGVMAVVEPQGGWYHLQQYGLGAPSALVRMMIQQSGCFDVVERGVAMQNMQQERALASGGDLRQDSSIGKGQMQAADFVLTPNVQVGSSNTGGIGGFVAGYLPGPLKAVVGGMKFKEASTSMLVSDVRSGIQVASAEGKATKTDFGIGGWGYGGGTVAGVGGYTNTPEGKMVAASLLDNYNTIVAQIRNQPQLVKTQSAAGNANAAAYRADAPQTAGETLGAKIGNVKIYAQPSRDAKVVGTVQKGEELIANGDAKNGFVFVDSANASGWVQRSLVAPMSPQAGSPAPSTTPAPPAGGGTSYLAPGLIGTFGGSFNGAEQGSFLVTVAANGLLSGSGNSSSTGDFGVSGRVDPSGRMDMTASGNAGSALFNGRIDGGSGAVSGTWRYQRTAGGGSFSGQRQ